MPIAAQYHFCPALVWSMSTDRCVSPVQGCLIPVQGGVISFKGSTPRIVAHTKSSCLLLSAVAPVSPEEGAFQCQGIVALDSFLHHAGGVEAKGVGGWTAWCFHLKARVSQGCQSLQRTQAFAAHKSVYIQKLAITASLPAQGCPHSVELHTG